MAEFWTTPPRCPSCPSSVTMARHAIGRVSSGAAQDRARTGAARAGAETSDEDFHRTGSRFEPEGERARQAAGEDYGRPAESEYAAEHESARTA